MSLDDKVLIVTGAGGNLGRATASALERAGARIVAADLHEQALQGSLASLAHPERHLGLGGIDLVNEAACTSLVARAVERFGRIDGLATTVGGFAGAPLSDTDAQLLLEMMRINVVTTVNVIRTVVPALSPGAGVVAIGAASARQAGAGIAAYAASKSAVFRIVESFAEELRPRGIRVNAVLPGTIDTPQNRAAMPEADRAGWVAPAQIASVIAFLLSDAAAGVTGALIPVIGTPMPGSA
jgi:NAD(P)-dependent dehydrogenase (short-subunit alcohol dehydrogenase family)